MFTGLIQDTSKVLFTKASPAGLAFGMDITLQKPETYTSLALGESISVNGVCLTLTAYTSSSISFFVGQETMLCTHFSTLTEGSICNLERSLTLGDRLGGHMVSGHVDGTAKLIESQTRGECLWLNFSLTPELLRYVIPKGSTTINGVSLTINNVDTQKGCIDVLLIPETLKRTNLSLLEVGHIVNIECDQTVKIIAAVVAQNIQHLKGLS